MSQYQERSLTCPGCQHVTVRSVAVSLDAERAKEERLQILDGTFQRFACPQCGQVARADGPLVWLDFDAKKWVGVLPEPMERQWWRYEREPQQAFQRNMVENAPGIVREWAPGFVIRAVFGLEALREKLVAWEAGLDDMLLEAYKLALLRSMGPFELGAAARPRLRAVRSGEGRGDGEGDVLEFWVPRPEEGQPLRLAKVGIARAELDRAAANRAEWAPVIAALSEGPYVDLGRLFIPRPEAPVAPVGAGSDGAATETE
jgi:CpXC protein